MGLKGTAKARMQTTVLASASLPGNGQIVDSAKRLTSRSIRDTYQKPTDKTISLLFETANNPRVTKIEPSIDQGNNTGTPEQNPRG